MAKGIRGNERAAGWLFVSPVVVILGLFLLLPIGMALWVSLSGWNGQGSPLRSDVPFVGARNYTRLFTQDGLAREGRILFSLRGSSPRSRRATAWIS